VAEVLEPLAGVTSAGGVAVALEGFIDRAAESADAAPAAFAAEGFDPWAAVVTGAAGIPNPAGDLSESDLSASAAVDDLGAEAL
jgi:hypothetical protein